MTARRVFLGLLFSLAAFPACDNIRSDEVQLRIRNASAVDFSSVVVRPSSQEEVFGAISAGDASTYREVARATEIDNIRVVAGGEDYQIVPFHDGYGDVLEPGRYTYVLNIRSSRLMIELERD